MRDLEDFAGIASDWFWETDADHRFTYFSARMQEVTKIRPEDVLGKRRDEQLAVCPDNASFEAHLEDLYNHRPFRNLEYKIKRQLSDGYLWLRVSGNPVFDPEGRFKGYRGTGHDITLEKEALERLETANAALSAKNQELEVLRRELELAAFEDPLTGLPNRRAFDGEIDEALHGDRSGVGLLLLDLDRFKWVNDTLGHPAGDMVLVKTAERLVNRCDTKAKAFRLGGDEFAIIVPRCPSLEDAVDLGRAIIKDARQPMSFSSVDFEIGASVGCAVTHGLPSSPSRLFKQADVALYDAKNGGRNRVMPVAKNVA
ncbi:sensor domain-containing protein [Pseudooctadecabacter jejudonensis]|uniref:Putative diguanylate cyclase YdaM n=1 Tax=Pseudooctadecabacter jejudonensis TaxID=1391910 RepID=A0A1Y5RZ67_9RHOB|nr:sensor domain-containing diguanylate cyclase [Pseudooctadecabacter jejudonensis]SLN28804.1 putative diguanylate cyclase YdaM [Pseudooctadecabacter jejudonensis]